MFFAIDAAFCSAERVTIAGSITPAATRSSISLVAAFRPCPFLALRTSLTTTDPSSPAFSASWRSGSSSALSTIRAPVCWSSLRAPSTLTALAACSSAIPPPGTMPSSSAARVAWSASSTRCFFSFISVSVAAPTLTTATPPESLARRSWSFSRSKSESVFSISDLIWLIRPLMDPLSPAPSTIVVVSLATTTRRARPSWESWVFSSFSPISSVITPALVRSAAALAVGEAREVLEHPLSAAAEARRLPRDAGERPAQLVDPQGGERLAIHVLSDDQDRLSALDHLLEHRQHVAHRADLLVGDED